MTKKKKKPASTSQGRGRALVRQKEAKKKSSAVSKRKSFGQRQTAVSSLAARLRARADVVIVQPGRRARAEVSDANTGFVLFRTKARQVRGELQKGRAIKRRLNQEPKGVAALAKRMAKRGVPLNEAIKRARILHNAGRIDAKGNLKR